MAKSIETATIVVTTPATMGWSVHNRSRRPMKKRRSAAWRRMGRQRMISGTRQRRMPSYRYWRMRMLSREMLDEPARYSRSHCLTSRPSDAESKLHTRLENHSVFKRTANPLAVNGIVVCATAGIVALTKFAFTLKLLSCIDICVRMAVWVSSGCCCSHL